MLRLFLLLLITLSLSACTSTNLQTYAPIDKRAKTITVTAGSSGLKGAIKKALSAQGWKMSVYSGPEVLEGSAGEKVSLKKYSTSNTRYTLDGYGVRVDDCLSFKDGNIFVPDLTYDIAIIDNKTGSEVLTMSGRGCQDEVVDALMKAVNGEKE